MSTTQALVAELKAELKASGVTYADLARDIGMSESSIKRIFAKGDMPLSRIDDMLRVLKIDFAELARRVADGQPLSRELTLAQEEAVVADRSLLLLALCCLSHWTFEQIASTYTLTDAQCIAGLVELDRLGIIELRPLNRYRLKVSKGFRWQPHGPVMRYFREHVLDDYYGGGFDREGELLMLVHGEISPTQASTFVDRLQRLGQDFAHQHLADQKLQSAQRCAYTLVVGMRSWEFAAFRDLKRDADP